MRDVRRLPTRLRVAVLLSTGAIVMMLGVLATPSPAGAHVDFVGSTPADASTVDGSISTITLRFSGTADPITQDFRVVTESGSSAPIASVTNSDSKTVVVTTRDPIPGGRNDVAWALRGTDGHRLTGTVGFTVATATASAAATPVPTTSPVASDPDASIATLAVAGPTDSGVADAIATIARWSVYLSILFCIGSLVYLAWVHRGSRAEGRRMVFYVRRAALAAVLGTIIAWFAELVARDGSMTAMVSPSTWIDLATTGFGLGTLLRLVGGLLVLRFVAIEVIEADGATSIDATSVDVDRLLLDRDSAISVSVTTAAPTHTRIHVESAPLAVIGALALVLSESFIGHTASVEPRVVMVLSDAIHLIAAGVWSAGAILLALTLWRRNRLGVTTDAHLLATRFSVAATAALIAVSTTGVVLSIAILDSPGRLFTTDFGRVLLLKMALVATIGFLGLHSRRVLLPAIEAGDPSASKRFRRMMSIESGLFVAVLLVTSILVISTPN